MARCWRSTLHAGRAGQLPATDFSVLKRHFTAENVIAIGTEKLRSAGVQSAAVNRLQTAHKDIPDPQYALRAEGRPDRVSHRRERRRAPGGVRLAHAMAAARTLSGNRWAQPLGSAVRARECWVLETALMAKRYPAVSPTSLTCWP